MLIFSVTDLKKSSKNSILLGKNDLYLQPNILVELRVYSHLRLITTGNIKLKSLWICFHTLRAHL